MAETLTEPSGTLAFKPEQARYRIPLKVLLHNTAFRVEEWSVHDFTISGIELDLGVGRTETFQLCFPLSDFNLVMPTQGIIRSIDTSEKRVRAEFTGLTPRQLSVIHQILDAYLAGDLIEMGDLLEMKETGKSDIEAVPAKPPERTYRERITAGWQAFAGYGIVVLASVALLLFVVSSLYERLFQSVPITAAIATDTVAIAAPVSGQITFLTDETLVNPGNSVASVKDRNGTDIFIEAPCTCRTVRALARPGQYVAQGKPIMVFSRDGTPPFVSAQVTYQQLLALHQGAQVDVEFTDGARLEDAKILELPAVDQLAAPEDATLLVRIDPGRDLAMSEVGKPVRVTFDTFAASSLARAFRGSGDAVAEPQS